jgi:hypothetical protein
MAASNHSPSLQLSNSSNTIKQQQEGTYLIRLTLIFLTHILFVLIFSS